MPDSLDFERCNEGRDIDICDVQSAYSSDDAENFTDPEFDDELAQFKLRMAKKQNSFRKWRMQPNVSSNWLSTL